MFQCIEQYSVKICSVTVFHSVSRTQWARRLRAYSFVSFRQMSVSTEIGPPPPRGPHSFNTNTNMDKTLFAVLFNHNFDFFVNSTNLFLYWIERATHGLKGEMV